MNAQPGTRLIIRRTLSVGAAVAIALVASGVPAAQAAKKSTSKKAKAAANATPAAGKSCPTINANASGLDCVRVGAALQWQPRGIKVNPFRVGDTGAFATTYRVIGYRLKVTSPAKVIDAAAIGAPDPTRQAIPAGSAPVVIAVDLTNTATDVGDPAAALTTFELVDGAGVRYALYSGAECAAFSSNAALLSAVVGAVSLRNVPPGTNTGAFCGVIPTAQVSEKLLLHVKVLDNSDVWFRTAA
jgi:hypothetical protein